MLAPTGSHVNANEKKKLQNLKIDFFKRRNGLDIWRTDSFHPQNLARFHAAISEKPELTDGGRTGKRWTKDWERWANSSAGSSATKGALLTVTSRAKYQYFPWLFHSDKAYFRLE